jgi:hypothetical protein
MFLPITLNVEKRRCALVGAGVAATSRRCTLPDYGAHVRIVSPVINHKQLRLNAPVELIERPCDREFLAGSFLVIAATDDPDVNRQVVSDAWRPGILVRRRPSAPARRTTTERQAVSPQGERTGRPGPADGPAAIREAVENLLHYGRAGSTPIAIFRESTNARQQRMMATPYTILAKFRNRTFRGPERIVVGPAVAAAQRKQWHGGGVSVL